MSLYIMTNRMKDMRTTQQEFHEIKHLLALQVAKLEEALEEANSVTWQEEKDEAMSRAISRVVYRLSNLDYDLRYGRDLLQEGEREGVTA